MMQRTTAMRALTKVATSHTKLTARAFSGNVEYPRIEGSVKDVTKQLNTIGARLSIPTASLYFTRQKLEYVSREMKSADELEPVQQAFLLADHKMAFPSTFAVGTFLSGCLKLESPEVALAYLEQAEHLKKYVNPGSFVRLAEYYDEQGEQANVEKVVELMTKAEVPMTTKMYRFRVMNAVKNGDLDVAEKIAREAAEKKEINSDLILQLVEHVDASKQKALAEYLISKGEVFVNEKLSAFIA